MKAATWVISHWKRITVVAGGFAALWQANPPADAKHAAFLFGSFLLGLAVNGEAMLAKKVPEAGQ